MNFNTQISTKNQEVVLPELSDNDCQVIIKREDQIHPLVSGNKFRKLKYNLQEAIEQKETTLLTFGGAFSNHILATAVAGELTGFKTIGIIRGDELGNDIEKTLATNSTLRNASCFIFTNFFLYGNQFFSNFWYGRNLTNQIRNF